MATRRMQSVTYRTLGALTVLSLLCASVYGLIAGARQASGAIDQIAQTVSEELSKYERSYLRVVRN